MQQGWFIPLDAMSDITQEKFDVMINTISHGGQVDVIARVDGKDYCWQCDGLKYAEFIGSEPAESHPAAGVINDSEGSR